MAQRQRGYLLRSLSKSKIAKTLAGMDMEQSEVVRMDQGKTARREGRCVFECSWEVANKVCTSIYFVIFIFFFQTLIVNLTFFGLHTKEADQVTEKREQLFLQATHQLAVFQVGGIYTVLRSKAPINTEEYGDQYCLLGPLREGRWQLEVEQIAPESRHIAAAIERLSEGGFKV
ncbi:unnamed protein product [Gongylonema pulchrum]|uniref:Glycogen [starch] synthase n=1 Tax=Gongylonema pulchrum TaxID=637853 RepID=A0A183CUN9_9BILA|nr:unnamed protein product [Gongylonema pulchrum]